VTDRVTDSTPGRRVHPTAHSACEQDVTVLDLPENVDYRCVSDAAVLVEATTPALAILALTGRSQPC
jgi:hypothetical protein